MDPASKIIDKFGGPKLVAFITGTALTAPYRWQAPREKGGGGGIIPQRHHATLLTHARANGIPLTAEDFLAVAGEATVAAAPPAEPSRDPHARNSTQEPHRFELPPEAVPTCPADSERATTPPPSPAPFSHS